MRQPALPNINQPPSQSVGRRSREYVASLRRRRSRSKGVVAIKFGSSRNSGNVSEGLRLKRGFTIFALSGEKDSGSRSRIALQSCSGTWSVGGGISGLVLTRLYRGKIVFG